MAAVMGSGMTTASDVFSSSLHKISYSCFVCSSEYHGITFTEREQMYVISACVLIGTHFGLGIFKWA